MDACACLAGLGTVCVVGLGWLARRAGRARASMPKTAGWLDGAVFGPEGEGS
jgi:hypothetical protein